jgi:hypothetical protein
MASVTVPIPPFTIPAGTTVFGPAVVVGTWTTVTLTLDLAGLVSASLLIEESSDLGVNWQPMLSIGGMLGDPVATAGDVTTITALPRTSTRVRATLTNAVAFASAGGSLVIA